MKKGWETKSLGDLCDILDYKRKPITKRDRVAGDYPYYGATGILDHVAGYIFDEPLVLLGEDGAKWGSGENSAFAVDGKVWVNNHAHVLRPHRNKLQDNWLIHYLNFSDLMGFVSGLTVPKLNQGNMRGIPVPVPPLPEQKRIVGILDEAFEGIATAKANAEKNLENARAIFESHLNDVFTKKGKGWVEKTFEDVCHKITDGTHHSPKTQFPARAPGTFPYITSKNIRNNFMDLSNVSYIERAFHKEVYARCSPSLGDVLLTKDGAKTGNVTLNTLDEPFSLLSSVCLIKTNPTVLRPAFLCYYLQSSTGLSSIVGQMTGTAIKRIVLKDIKKAVMQFPPLKEQDIIVTKLNSLLAETQGLASIYQRKLDELEALKKSLLHQAFAGPL